MRSHTNTWWSHNISQLYTQHKTRGSIHCQLVHTEFWHAERYKYTSWVLQIQAEEGWRRLHPGEMGHISDPAMSPWSIARKPGEAWRGKGENDHAHLVSHPGDDKLLSNTHTPWHAVPQGFQEGIHSWVSVCMSNIIFEAKHSVIATHTQLCPPHPHSPKTHWLCNARSEPKHHPSITEICRLCRLIVCLSSLYSSFFPHIALPNQEWDHSTCMDANMKTDDLYLGTQ